MVLVMVLVRVLVQTQVRAVDDGVHLFLGGFEEEQAWEPGVQV